MPKKHSEQGFFFVRHGETISNRNKVRSGGECNPPLTPLGKQQIELAETVLSSLDRIPGLMLTSPHIRTYDTACILNKSLKVKVLVDDGLKERKLGSWNGKSYDSTREQLKAGKTPPGGEAEAEFRERVLRTFKNRAGIYMQWPAIISSSGVARVILEHAGKTREYASGLDNGSILSVWLDDPVHFSISCVEMVYACQARGHAPKGRDG